MLASNLPAPVVIVQHMPAKFTKSLADRLNRLSSLTVCEAQNGEVLQKGRVYVAPGGCHMKVKDSNGRLISEIIDGSPVHGVKPSVDVMLRSLAEAGDGGCRFVVAILTGMGRDGADGLVELKKKRVTYAIAESAETAVVFFGCQKRR
ncbi:CheB methylesterase domain-containing protein [Terrilactibacillus sp. S3-3]|nr:CheB methylesterase domain-containing protein [Terrilactibacillus sp. S3-3]